MTGRLFPNSRQRPHQKARYTGHGESENRCTAIAHRHGVRKEQRCAA